MGIQGLADFLSANLSFFFIPPGVALMLYFDLIAAEIGPIAVAIIVSMTLVIIVTGWVHQITREKIRKMDYLENKFFLLFITLHSAFSSSPS